MNHEYNIKHEKMAKVRGGQNTISHHLTQNMMNIKFFTFQVCISQIHYRPLSLQCHWFYECTAQQRKFSQSVQKNNFWRSFLWGLKVKDKLFNFHCLHHEHCDTIRLWHKERKESPVTARWHSVSVEQRAHVWTWESCESISERWHLHQARRNLAGINKSRLRQPTVTRHLKWSRRDLEQSDNLST